MTVDVDDSSHLSADSLSFHPYLLCQYQKKHADKNETDNL